MTIVAGLIDYNFMCLRRAIKDVFNVGRKAPSIAAGEGVGEGETSGAKASGGIEGGKAPLPTTGATSDAVPVATNAK